MYVYDVLAFGKSRNVVNYIGQDFPQKILFNIAQGNRLYFKTKKKQNRARILTIPHKEILKVNLLKFSFLFFLMKQDLLYGTQRKLNSI